MNDAAIYRRVHVLLRSAKLARWRISRTAADDQWRMTSPSGATVTIAARPTVRALLNAEAGFDRTERSHPTAGTGLAQQEIER